MEQRMEGSLVGNGLLDISLLGLIWIEGMSYYYICYIISRPAKIAIFGHWWRRLLELETNIYKVYSVRHLWADTMGTPQSPCYKRLGVDRRTSLMMSVAMMNKQWYNAPFTLIGIFSVYNKDMKICTQTNLSQIKMFLVIKTRLGSSAFGSESLHYNRTTQRNIKIYILKRTKLWMKE